MMKSRLSLIAGAAALLASLSVVAGAGAASKSKTAKAKHKCVVVANNQTSGSTTGYDYGAEKCSKPFGSGLTIITYKEVVSGTHFTDSGKFKNFYNRGTTHGTYSLSGTIPTGSSTIAATGAVKILGGTGAFAHSKFKGKMTCATNDAGAQYTCVATF
jgi:hypothetical protein